MGATRSDALPLGPRPGVSATPAWGGRSISSHCWEEYLFYKSQDSKTQFLIPQGASMSPMAMINHWDTRLFPDPHAFNPERRLLPDGKPDYNLQKFLISFSKGSWVSVDERRGYFPWSSTGHVEVGVYADSVSCSVALCKVYVMATMIAFRVIPKAGPFETTIEDLTYDHDLAVLQTKKGPDSTRIKISLFARGCQNVKLPFLTGL